MTRFVAHIQRLSTGLLKLSCQILLLLSLILMHSVASARVCLVDDPGPCGSVAPSSSPSNVIVPTSSPANYDYMKCDVSGCELPTTPWPNTASALPFLSCSEYQTYSQLGVPIFLVYQRIVNSQFSPAGGSDGMFESEQTYYGTTLASGHLKPLYDAPPPAGNPVDLGVPYQEIFEELTLFLAEPNELISSAIEWNSAIAALANFDLDLIPAGWYGAAFVIDPTDPEKLWLAIRQGCNGNPPAESPTPQCAVDEGPQPSGCPPGTPTATASASASATASMTASVSVTPTPAISPTSSPAASSSPSASSSRAPSSTPSMTATPTVSLTPSPTVSITPSVTASVTPSITATPSSTISVTPSTSASVTPTISISPSATVSLTPSVTASPSVSLSATPSATASISNSPSSSPSASPAQSGNVTASPSASETASPSDQPPAFSSPQPSNSSSPPDNNSGCTQTDEFNKIFQTYDHNIKEFGTLASRTWKAISRIHLRTGSRTSSKAALRAADICYSASVEAWRHTWLSVATTVKRCAGVNTACVDAKAAESVKILEQLFNLISDSGKRGFKQENRLRQGELTEGYKSRVRRFKQRSSMVEKALTGINSTIGNLPICQSASDELRTM